MAFEHYDLDHALEDESERLHALELERFEGQHVGYDAGAVSSVGVEGADPNAGTAAASGGTRHVFALCFILRARLWPSPRLTVSSCFSR